MKKGKTLSSEKKKPKIEYEVSDNGNVIEARIDEKTSFISLKKPMKKRKKGGLRFLPGFGAEGETESENEWLMLVWEEGELMPPSVWDEKRRKEILELAKDTISTVSGANVENISVSAGTGTVWSWDAFARAFPEKCKICGAPLPPNAKYCYNCGKPIS